MRKIFTSLAVLGLGLALNAAAQGTSPDYKLAAQDVIKVEVFNEADLSVERRVSAKGEINFPLLNTVHVAGKTPAEVEQMLKKLLDADYIVDPTVSVTVKNYRSRTISVLGAVTKAGPVELPAEGKGLTIVEAIAAAGGRSKGATMKIDFTRNGVTKELRLDDLVNEKDPKKIIYLMEGDVVSVKESLL
jgi:protein involved in polysaccharide export with SLBB domain